MILVKAMDDRDDIVIRLDEDLMLYTTNEDLPDSITRHLPPHGQDLYRVAFNQAYAAHERDPLREEAAHQIAWAAVKLVYAKAGDAWVLR